MEDAALSRLAKKTKVLPEATRGGFLFEAMGLGKTVEMIALMTKNPPSPDVPLRFTIADLALMPSAAAIGGAPPYFPSSSSSLHS